MANKYKTMSDEELKELAKEKYKKSGLFKGSALAAQEELWERTHYYRDPKDWVDIDSDEPRDIIDIQYNG